MSGPAITTGRRVHRDDDDQQAVLGQMLSVAQNGGADITDAQTVDKQTAGRYRIAQTGGILADLDRTADLSD